MQNLKYFSWHQSDVVKHNISGKNWSRKFWRNCMLVMPCHEIFGNGRCSRSPRMCSIEVKCKPKIPEYTQLSTTNDLQRSTTYKMPPRFIFTFLGAWLQIGEFRFLKTFSLNQGFYNCWKWIYVVKMHVTTSKPYLKVAFFIYID